MKKKNGVLTEVSEKDLKLLIKNPKKFWEGVTSIGSWAFGYRKSLKNIIIPNSVTLIGDNAFSHCENLKSIIIPNSVTCIEYEAFRGCTSLTNVTIPDGVTSIENGVFSGCTSLTNVTIPDSVTLIGKYAFNYCESLTNVTIPNNVTRIGSCAFTCCKSLTNITIPNSVIFISEGILSGCHNLKKVILPNGVEISNRLLITNFDFLIYKRYSKEILEKHKNDYTPPLMWKELEGLNLKEYINLIKNYGIDKETKELNVEEDNLTDFIHFGYNLGLFSNETIKVKNSSGKEQELPISNLAHNVIQKMILSGMELNSMHIYFQAMKKQEFNEQFLRFLLNKTNLDEVIAEEQKHNGFIVKLYDWFKERTYLTNLGEIEDSSNRTPLPTSEANRFKIRVYETTESGIDKLRWREPTVDTLKKEFIEKVYAGVTPEKRHIAECLLQYPEYSKQMYYDKAVEIDDERIKAGVPNHLTSKHVKQSTMDAYRQYFEKTEGIRQQILETADKALIEQKESADQIFSYEMLSKDSEEIFAIGSLVPGAPTLFGADAGPMRAVIISSDMQPLVIRDSKDNIVAFSIVYVNRKEGYAVVKGFEVKRKYRGNDKACKAIYDKAMQGIDAFVRAYNEDNPNNPIKVVTCGVSPDHVDWEVINNYVKRNPKSKILKVPNLDEWSYAGGLNLTTSWPGDWRKKQYKIWEPDKHNNLEV